MLSVSGEIELEEATAPDTRLFIRKNLGSRMDQNHYVATGVCTAFGN